MIKKEKKIVLFAVHYPLAGYLLELIRSAFWLGNQYNKKKYDRIKIKIILLQSPLNLSRNIILKKIFSYFISFLGDTLKKNLLSKIANLRNKNQSKIINKLLFIFETILETSIIDKVCDKNSIYEILKRKGGFSVNYNYINIIFQNQKYNYLFKLNIFFKSFFTAIILYKNCFNKFRFIPQTFLSIHHNNIHIGDLVASYTVRIYSQTGGQLMNTLGLFINLVNGIYINNLASSTELDKDIENFICPSEPFYTHQIWLRNFRKKDIQILETHDPAKKFKICLSHEYNNPWIAEKPVSANFDYEASNEYLNKRVFSPASIIDSFSKKNFTNNNFEKEIYDHNGSKVQLDHSKLNTVLFLHDFSDALYADGLDGFNDLFEWTTFTLNKLFDNNNIEKILLKPHPSADFIASRANKIAFDKIYKIYSKNKKIIFLDKNSSLTALCEKKKLYGITHHGNIALEIVYLDQPAIGWINGPWGSYYQFLKTWKQKEDYAELLSELNYENWKPPSLKEKELLYMYISNFELKRMTNEKKSIRVYLTNNLKRLSGCSHKEFEKKMRKIKVDDILFSEVLDKIYEKSLTD